jgi:hypothetical protein
MCRVDFSAVNWRNKFPLFWRILLPVWRIIFRPRLNAEIAMGRLLDALVAYKSLDCGPACELALM